MSSSSSSPAALLVSLASVAIFGYSTYYMNFNPNLGKMVFLQPEGLRQFGQIKFLTYQCLLIQFVSSILHVLAHFIKPLRGLRDLWFTCLAYPVGSMVVYTFWAVWHGMGRELIFPAELSQYYPDWLNHATHTIIAPLNMLLLLLANHTYRPRGVIITLLYMLFYMILLHYIKFKTGWFVYRYLDAMNQVERTIYFAGTAIMAYLMYKLGQLLNGLLHPKKPQQARKAKQK